MPPNTRLLSKLWPVCSLHRSLLTTNPQQQPQSTRLRTALQLLPDFSKNPGSSAAYISTSAHLHQAATPFHLPPLSTSAAAARQPPHARVIQHVQLAAPPALPLPSARHYSNSSAGGRAGDASSEGRVLHNARAWSDDEEDSHGSPPDRQDFSEVLQQLHKVTSGTHQGGVYDNTTTSSSSSSSSSSTASGDPSDPAAILGQYNSSDERLQRLRFRRQQPKFEVIEFREDGSAIELYGPRTPQELGLHPRDVTLFAPLSRLAAPQRATISVREDKVLFKTEVAKAIIMYDKTLLIKGRRMRDTKRLAHDLITANDARIMQQEDLMARTARASPLGLGSCERAASAADLRRATQAAKMGAGGLGPGVEQKGAGAGAGASGLLGRAADVPFEFVVLEVLLDATTEYFYNKTQHLNWMMESLSDEMRGAPRPFMATDKAHQLVPIQKFLTAIKNDVRETCEAIQELLEDDDALAGLCLTWRHQLHRPPQWQPIELNRQGAAAAASSPGPMHPPPHQPGGSSNGNGGGHSSHSAGSLHGYHAAAGGGGSSSGSHGYGYSQPHSSSSSSSGMPSTGSHHHNQQQLYHSGGTAAAAWQQQQHQQQQIRPGGISSAARPTGGAEFVAAGGAASASQVIQHHEECDQHYVVRRPPPQLSPPPPVAALYKAPEQHLRMVTEMLESYEREIHSIEGSLKEAEENLENTRQMWHMQLDSSRNHIILINLWLSMISISVMATTIIPAFFGMNLGSGLPDSDPAMFYGVCTASLVVAAVSFPLARGLFIRHWQRLLKQDQHEQRMLKVLLVQHLDDLDDIIAALRPWRDKQLDRRTFKKLVTATLGPRAIPPSQIDFMWSIFDKNHDGFLSTAKLMKALAEQSKDFMPPNDTGVTMAGSGGNGSSSSSSRREADPMPLRTSRASAAAAAAAAARSRLKSAAGVAGGAAAAAVGLRELQLTDSDDDDWSWDKYRDV